MFMCQYKFHKKLYLSQKILVFHRFLYYNKLDSVCEFIVTHADTTGKPEKGSCQTMVNITNDKGSISITSEVLTYLAGDAATRCFGVKGMAGRSKEGGPLQLLRRESMSKGVKVSFNDDGSINLDLHIGVDYGVNMAAVANSIMSEVSYKLTKSAGVPVSRVNVYIDTIIG